MLLDNVPGRLGDALGLITIKACRLDFFFEFGKSNLCEILRCTIFLEELRRHHIDPLVGALRRKDCGD